MKKPSNKETAEKDKKRLKSLVTPPSDESPLDCVHGTKLGAFTVCKNNSGRRYGGKIEDNLKLYL